MINLNRLNMKKLVLSLAFVLMGSFAVGQELTKEQIKAQKKEKKVLLKAVQDAETNIATDPVGAARVLSSVTTNPLMNENAYVWYVSANAKKAIIDGENRKRAEGAAFNEEMMYNYVHEICTDLENCEKYDNMPDEKGRVKPKYTEFIKLTIGQEYGQFYNGGAFFYGKGEYMKSADLFKMFIDASDRLCKDGLIPEDTVNVPVAAYNIALCGMQIKDYDLVLSQIDLALKNSNTAPNSFYYMTDAYLQKGDTVKWLALCKEGIVKYPDNLYYSQALIHHYDVNNQNEELDRLADDLIKNDPNNPLFVYLKGYIAHQKEDIDKAITWYEKTLQVDPNYENAVSNLGRCYLIKAQQYNAQQSSVKVTDKKKIAEDKKVLDGYYNKALPLLEQMRRIAPDKPEQWLLNLINCYYNLNMSEKLKEVEELKKSLGY